MVTKRAVIQNDAGIHVRPSGVIMQEASGYAGTIVLRTKSAEAPLESVIGLIALGLAPGDWVDVTVSGPDEERTCDALVELFERRYDFPPKTS